MNAVTICVCLQHTELWCSECVLSMSVLRKKDVMDIYLYRNKSKGNAENKKYSIVSIGNAVRIITETVLGRTD